MAYQRPLYDSRSPHEPERPRSTWDPVQRNHYPAMASPSHHVIPSPNLFDPESESSDVSDNPGDDYQTRVHSTFPIAIPPPPAKHNLESLESIDSRSRELQHIEDVNIKKFDQLKAKRARKDEKIRRKREAQDLKIKAIMDVRARRDDRIARRRKLEDEAFERFDQDLEEEENNLRHRRKRLKRGLPVEDMGAGSRISSASMSPPGPPYSGAPPPKRHQTGPPGQNDSPIVSNPRPISYSAPSGPPSTGPNPPPYAFLQSSHAPTSAPYGRSPTISNSPSSNSGVFQPMPRSHQPPPEPSPYGINGHPPSPHTSRPQVPPPGPTLNTVPPPRSTSSAYDTRPPPPVSSGFAPINPPPASGFAPINPRNTATPPAPASIPLPKSTEHERSNGHIRPYASEGTPTGGSSATGSKRTPSTTHPYQMSEAFANRHHHCERVDHLGRGIWTSYGPGGTKESPTGQQQEMYLRCNHDGCRRIDWRTVHGLQCHIVKNHEQPKGTIGSLEKALDRYGVPVTEVEAYEREHGDGTGGTMADPKNLKIKQKTKDSIEKADANRRPYATPTNAATYHANLAKTLGNSAQPYQGSPPIVRSLTREETDDSTESEPRSAPVNPAIISTQPSNRFAAVNGAWSSHPDQKPIEPKDHEMKDAPPAAQLPGTPSSTPSGPASVPKRDAAFWKGWPKTPGSTEAGPANETPIRQAAPVPIQATPTHAPLQPPIQATSSTIRPEMTPLTSTPLTQTPSGSMGKPNLTPKQETSPSGPNKEAQPPPAQPAQSPVTDRPASKIAQTVEDTPRTGVSGQEETPSKVSVPEKEKEAPVVQEVFKEPEKAKVETIEPPRPELKSPENLTRRGSTGRRANSRRSSVLTASKAIKEEREKEEAAAAEAEKERERKGPEENTKVAEPEPEKDTEKEGEPEREEDSDDPDTITAAVPATSGKDKDKEKEARDNKTTTPRRLANGRFVRKRDLSHR